MRNEIRKSCYVILAIVGMMAGGFAQRSGGGSGSGGGTRGNTPAPRPRTSTRTMDQSRGTVLVQGRVLMETGQPVPEPVSVELNCGLRPLQVIHTDLGGYFTFNLGGGMQSNFDFSASNESPSSLGTPNRQMGTGTGLVNPLRGCELRISVAGYHPVNRIISEQQNTGMGQVNVGTIHLQRVAEAEGSAISVTSLLVPKDARKEYDRAMKDLEKKKTKSARGHLEKAIQKYDKYAAAWYQMGRLDLADGNKDKAEESMERAIAIDGQYVPPYLDLAVLQVQDQQWQAAVETTTKVLSLDRSLGFASFLNAVGNFNLNQMDAAEQSARDAEKWPHENIPQVHALLAEILLRKEQYVEAVKNMREYLKESPDGNFAEQMKKNLAELEPHLPASAQNTEEPAAPDGQ